MSEIDFQMETDIVISEVVRQFSIEDAFRVALSEWNTKYKDNPSIAKRSEWLTKRTLEIFRAT